jgi:hypothetical protein
VGLDPGAAMNAFFVVAAVLACIPVLVLVWALFLLVFREAALLAISTLFLVPVFGPWIIVFNVLVVIAMRAICRRKESP